MPEVSLICATRGRKAELVALLESLTAQTYRDFEVIVVDQNEPGFLDEALTAFVGKLNLSHVRLSEFGVSLARNQGIARSRGHIIGFPDDDCEYPADLLERVMQQFAQEPALDFFSGACRNKQDGQLAASKFAAGRAVLNVKNFWLRHVASSLFVTRAACLQVGRFDERIGVGRRLGSAEETDYVLRLLLSGAYGRYDSDIFVHHPPEPKDGSPRSLQRAWRYGLGWGGFVHKHWRCGNGSVVLPAYLRSLFRSLGGCIWMLLCCRLRLARYYAYSFAGRCWGMMVPFFERDPWRSHE